MWTSTIHSPSISILYYPTYLNSYFKSEWKNFFFLQIRSFFFFNLQVNSHLKVVLPLKSYGYKFIILMLIALITWRIVRQKLVLLCSQKDRNSRKFSQVLETSKRNVWNRITGFPKMALLKFVWKKRFQFSSIGKVIDSF